MLNTNLQKFHREMADANKQNMQEMIQLNTETLAAISSTMTSNFTAMTATQDNIARTLVGVAAGMKDLGKTQAATARSLLNLEERLSSEPSFRGRSKRKEKGKQKASYMDVDSEDKGVAVSEEIGNNAGAGGAPSMDEETATDDAEDNDGDSEHSDNDTGNSRGTKTKSREDTKKAENTFKVSMHSISRLSMTSAEILSHLDEHPGVVA